MKNPWMSMWLSAANTMMSASRGQAAAQIKRSQTAMIAEMQRQAFALWAPQLAPAPIKKRARTNRRRS